MPSSHLILCRPLLLLPSIPPSIRVFSNESTLRIRWPKYWSFSFSISPSNEQPGRISFRMDWLDLLAVQGTLKSLFQHHSSKASIFQRSAFFTVQLSHPYMTTGETIVFSSLCYCCCWVASVASDSVWTYGLQPARLLCPWDSPDRSTGVGCHALLQIKSIHIWFIFLVGNNYDKQDPPSSSARSRVTRLYAHPVKKSGKHPGVHNSSKHPGVHKLR